MADDDLLTYSDRLTELGIEHTIVEHPASREIAGVLDHLGLTFADCVPTLVMRADGSYVAVVIRGDTRADFKKVKRALGARDLRMATPEEFGEATGLPVGAARVYNPGMRTVLDIRVFERDYLTGGSGRFDRSVRVRAADLRKLPDSLVADVNREVAPG
jgi:prolyl-tRNA editing enzyme YbaK/EbsC (Cys-tRNA(Pro) deacylase)